MSLGQGRLFEIRSMPPSGEHVRVILGNGDFCTVEGMTPTQYCHCVHTESKCIRLRVSKSSSLACQLGHSIDRRLACDPSSFASVSEVHPFAGYSVGRCLTRDANAFPSASKDHSCRATGFFEASEESIMNVTSPNGRQWIISGMPVRLSMCHKASTHQITE